MIQMLLIAWESYNSMVISFSANPYLIRAGRKKEKMKNRKSKNMAEKTFTLSQTLDYWDNLEVSSDSEKESLGNLQSAKIYLQPPLNSKRPSSDVDSGDGNTAAAADTSNLLNNQLLSSAVLEIKCPSGKVIVGQSEDTATKAPVQKAKRRKKDNSQHVNKWIHSDISLPTGFKWTLPDPVLETVEPPVSLFEKFFTDEIMKFFCEESIRHAISNGNHSFTIDTNTLKINYRNPSG